MQNLIRQLIVSMDYDLEILNSKSESPLKKSNEAITIHNRYLNTLKSIVVKGTFESLSDEIEFFKHTKPKVLGGKLFYLKVIYVESRKPIAANLLEDFYVAQIKKAQAYLKDDLDFYSYIRSDKSHLDEKYFLRGNTIDEWDYEISMLCTDPLFSTGYDIKVALWIAHKQLVEYLSNALADIKKQMNEANLPPQLPEWKWTESKVALVELIYALHATRCINHGRSEIKDMAIFFETVFQTNIGDIYHHFMQIKERNTPTKLIDSLKNGLLQRIEEQNIVD